MSLERFQPPYMTTAQRTAVTPNNLDLIIDSDLHQLFVGDGSTVGGVPVPSGQVAHIADAKTDYTAGDLDSEAEIIDAINALNGKINSILAALESVKILLSS